MSRISTQRIVGRSEEDLEELVCGICRDIFDRPVVTQCCRQTFCTVCINQWLVNHKTCPTDRKPLRTNELMEAPRVVTNMVNKLNIKCINHMNGCDFISTVEVMDKHMKTCLKKGCDSCKTSRVVIENQVKEVDLLKKKIKSMETELAQAQQQIKNITSVKPITEGQAIALARQHINTHSIKKSDDLDKQTEQSFVANSKNAIKRCDNFLDISEYIKDRIDEYTGLEWGVMTLKAEDPFGFDMDYFGYIEIEIGPIAICGCCLSE